ncbi:MAG: hypothetical protein ACE5JT_02105 [Nitrosopumilaceae archaeon]
MGLFKRKKNNQTRCKECGLELHSSERLERHHKKAHGKVPQRKDDASTTGESGGMW